MHTFSGQDCTSCTLFQGSVAESVCTSISFAFAGTKQVYHASPKPVIYNVPAQLILSLLALVPVGEHGTIPHSLHANSSVFERDKCDKRGRPGMGSKLFCINSWAMIWTSDHQLPKKEDYKLKGCWICAIGCSQVSSCWPDVVLSILVHIFCAHPLC